MSITKGKLMSLKLTWSPKWCSSWRSCRWIWRCLCWRRRCQHWISAAIDRHSGARWTLRCVRKTPISTVSRIFSINKWSREGISWSNGISLISCHVELLIDLKEKQDGAWGTVGREIVSIIKDRDFHLSIVRPLSFTDCAKSRTLCASFTEVFLDAIAKANKLICKTIAQNLMPVSLTKSCFSFGNGI